MKKKIKTTLMRLGRFVPLFLLGFVYAPPYKTQPLSFFCFIFLLCVMMMAFYEAGYASGSTSAFTAFIQAVKTMAAVEKVKKAQEGGSVEVHEDDGYHD